MDRVGGQAFETIALGDGAREDRAHRAVYISNGQIQPHRLLAFEGRFAKVDQLPVKRVREAMVLLFLTRAGDRRINRGLVKNGGEIQALRLPVINGRLRFELIGAPDHLLELAEAECGH